MLEAIIRFRRCALHKQNVGLGEPFQRHLKRHVFRPGHRAKERIGKVAPDNGADLHHLARWAKAVEPRRQRLTSLTILAAHFNEKNARWRPRASVMPIGSHWPKTPTADRYAPWATHMKTCIPRDVLS